MTFKKFFSYLLLTIGFALGSCSGNEPELLGSFHKSALRLSVNPDQALASVGSPSSKSSESGIAIPAVDEFTVSFTPVGESEPEATYRYAEMPEIITLPVGDYSVTATCGKNPAAAWNAPYFTGQIFISVNSDDVTIANPIVCTIANIRVSVVFDESIAAANISDSGVELSANGVTIGMTPAEAAAGSVYVAPTGEPITATFRGKLNGSPITATHIVASPLPTHHYRITFRYDSQIHD